MASSGFEGYEKAIKQAEQRAPEVGLPALGALRDELEVVKTKLGRVESAIELIETVMGGTNE